MLNKKVILLSGFSRGGTNIAWNILQSHPEICSARYETGQILRKRNPIILNRLLSIINKIGLGRSKLAFKYLNYKFHYLKMSNLQVADNINPDVITFNREAASALDYFGYDTH